MKKCIAILVLGIAALGSAVAAQARQPIPSPHPPIEPRYHACVDLPGNQEKCTTCYYSDVAEQCVCEITISTKR